MGSAPGRLKAALGNSKYNQLEGRQRGGRGGGADCKCQGMGAGGGGESGFEAGLERLPSA